MPAPIRVLIVDDHPVVRHGLRGMLANVAELEIVGEAADGVKALEETTRLEPDVVLLDIRMPGQDGIRVAPQIRRISPRTRIIVLTMYDDFAYVSKAIEAGADGYILKQVGSAELARAIKAVHMGQRVASQEVTSELIAEFAVLAREHARWSLSLCDIELQVLEGMAHGCTYRELALRLSCSEVTVRRRVQGIYRKLNVSDRAEAVAVAVRSGLI